MRGGMNRNRTILPGNYVQGGNRKSRIFTLEILIYIFIFFFIVFVTIVLILSFRFFDPSTSPPTPTAVYKGYPPLVPSPPHTESISREWVEGVNIYTFEEIVEPNEGIFEIIHPPTGGTFMPFVDLFHYELCCTIEPTHRKICHDQHELQCFFSSRKQIHLYFDIGVPIVTKTHIRCIFTWSNTD